MRIVGQSLVAASLLAGVSIAAPASATTSVGGISFADNAFADAVSYTGSAITTVGGTLTQVLTDTDPGTFARGGADNTITFSFIDNVAVNGVGKDIALFELGGADDFTVILNGISKTYTSVYTGMMAGGYNLNVLAFDLGDFGVLAGQTISSLTLAFPANGAGTRATPSLVGAINSSTVPEPATWGMMILGFGAIGSAMRRRESVRVRFAG